MEWHERITGRKENGVGTKVHSEYTVGLEDCHTTNVVLQLTDCSKNSSRAVRENTANHLYSTDLVST